MIIREIELNNFRNYKREKAEFHKKVNFFIGNNAQGKTNLIESIYLLSMAKSFRTLKDKELIDFEESYCRIKAIAEKKDEEYSVEIAINKEGKKGIKVDGVKIEKISSLLDNIYVVIFSPEDLKIIKEDPEKRRNFIDREICQIKPVYYDNLKKYKKVLSQRNHYLKEENIDSNFLDVLDEKLVEYGKEIIKEREIFIKKIEKISKQIHENITGGKEVLKIEYAFNTERDYFRESLKEALKSDRYNKNTGVGPHRDDIKVFINNIDVRHFGSQGQQRTAALSIKLAEINLIREEKGETPILLLDDVLSELDNERQNYLINSLEEAQLFITTTEISPELKKVLPQGKTFYIKKGEIING